ncbi:isoquinoline 1-oxidoreductase [Sulfitobacter sp. SK012]|uniref:xanthine dehydrogenase family protein molybdopterin-binding subunit n=1 Tax=Sulfitobacter sp. SK012 TaxID=1389005 RepID=UPI000E0B3933|nr:molybdopterin cofactor-binding domain-containing protein [Sulfitobacter sp. SK012]AXI47671.1 isoquinoline 1-oxidoreductase [Sulfitobacter sp. SK012]
MGRIKTIARRSFLVGSAAVLGGVAFGTYLVRKPIDNPLLDNLAEGDAALTPYVLINADGITLITPRADVGQGSYSVQAHLIAEELDVDLTQVRIEHGTPSAAYFNGVVAAEAMPIAATSDTFLAQQGRGAAYALSKVLGLQITGGSSTVPDAYEKLRLAGAVARETLVAAAMQQTGLDRAALKTEDGAVMTPDGTRIDYTALAQIAATLDPVEDVTLRDPASWKYIGKPQMRTDVIAKSTGTQTYGVDLRFDGMVYATTRTNPARGGGIKGFDGALAQSMRGVLHVLPITDGVAVVADNTWRAFQAADALDCDWGPALYIGDTQAQFDAVAASYTKDLQDSRFRDDGDVDEALRASQDMTQAEYRVPYLAHAPLEPMSVVVTVTDARIDIWTGTQIPGFLIDNVARLTGRDAAQIHLHVIMSGGSFGRRLEDDYVLQAVEIAAQIPDTPVKMIWSREEDFSHDFPRTLGIAKARGSLKNGQIESFDLSIACPSTSESSLVRMGQPAIGPDIVIVAGAWDQPYAIPNYRVTGYRAPQMVPISSWRSVGASGNGFFHESFLDEMCHAAGADPMEERLRLCRHEPTQKVLEAVAEMSDWGSDLGPGRGRGVAMTLSFGVPVAEVVEVTNTSEGIRIDKVFVAAEVGRIIDPINFEAQVTGGVIWALGHAMNCELTYKDGAPEQANYHDYEGMRLYQTPQIMVRGLENNKEIRGIGEPAVPPAAPALANAIFAATGQRIREMPLNKHVRFV